jgi:tetratricopeptide (TPR) repeat protein
VLFSLGTLHHGEERFETAADHFERALRIVRTIGDERYESFYRGYLGMVRIEQRRLENARADLVSSVSTLRELGDVRYASLFRALEGGVLAQMGRLDEARAAIDEAERAIRDPAPNDPIQSAILLQRGYLELATPGQRDLARQRLETARREGAPERSFELRIAVRTLASFVGDGISIGAPRVRASEGARSELVVHREVYWFESRAGRRVPCRKRKVTRAILMKLVAQRIDSPGRALTAGDLLEAGWPGERILPQAAMNRLYVMLTKLRQLGLRDVLLATDDGYLLDPNVPVRLVE